MNMIGKIEAAATAGGWTYSRGLTGDGFTRLAMTRGPARAVVDLRYYYGKPKIIRASLGGPDRQRCTVGEVLTYLAAR